MATTGRAPSQQQVDYDHAYYRKVHNRGRLTLLIALIPWLTAAPAHAADNSVLGIVVRTVTPVVAGAGDPITLQLGVSNSASSPSAPTTLNVLLGTEGLDDTAAVDAWAAGHQAASGRLVAQTEVPAIPAGSVTPLTVTLARAGDLTRRPYDVVALSLEIGSAITHTFVGVQRAKEFEPLSVAWLVPVTLDAQPGLWTSPSVDRWHAWEDALADDSRIGRLITATRGTEVTLAVDGKPALRFADSAPVRTADTAGILAWGAGEFDNLRIYAGK